MSKSNLFLEQSGELDKVQNPNLRVDLRDEFFSLKTDIDNIESRFYKLFDEFTDDESIRNINSELMILNNELAIVEDEINVDLEKIISDSKEEVRCSLLDEIEDDHALVEYFVGPEYSYVLGFTKGIKVFRRFQMDSLFRTSFAEIINQIRDQPKISEYSSSLSRFKKSSGLLYNRLLKSVIDQLPPSVEFLTIVPDEQLSKLPFEVLISNEGDLSSHYNELNYLVKDYTVSYSLSSRELDFCAEGAQLPRKRATLGLLGIGFSGNSVGGLRSGLADLPGTEKEIEFLRESFDGDFYLGDNGDKSTFLKSAKDYDVLHLAIHGEADSTDRFTSKLIFNGTDSLLFTRDLYVAGLKARLAILSACESGTGEINKGEGTFSIARGFALVGVPSVVMSLWKVNDRITSELMVDLHKGLSVNQSVDVALALTKRKYLLESDQYTGHPYYWSAFVSLGEKVRLNEKRPLGNFVYLGVALLILLLLSVIWVKRKGVN